MKTALKGYNLIECLVVLLLLCVLLLLALPKFSTLREAYYSRVMHEKLVEDIEGSLVLSRQGRKMSVVLASDGWRVKTAEQPEDHVALQASYLLHYRVFPSGSHMLHFPRWGGDYVGNATLWLCRRHQSLWAVSVNRLGRVKTKLPNSAGQLVDSKNHLLVC